MGVPSFKNNVACTVNQKLFRTLVITGSRIVRQTARTREVVETFPATCYSRVSKMFPSSPNFWFRTDFARKARKLGVRTSRLGLLPAWNCWVARSLGKNRHQFLSVWSADGKTTNGYFPVNCSGIHCDFWGVYCIFTTHITRASGIFLSPGGSPKSPSPEKKIFFGGGGGTDVSGMA